MKRRKTTRKAKEVVNRGRGERMRIGMPYMLISKSGLVFNARLYSVGRSGASKTVIFTNVR